MGRLGDQWADIERLEARNCGGSAGVVANGLDLWGRITTMVIPGFLSGDNLINDL